MRILIIEDDAKAAAYARDGLHANGHIAECASHGTDGLKQAALGDFDAIVVDRMLPGLDGLSIVKSLRQAQCICPIIIVTAMDGIEDRIDGLDGGADDYLIKPFHIGELVARIHALARRARPSAETIALEVGDLKLNLLTRKVTRGGTPIELQSRELKLLEVLMRNHGIVMTRAMLLKEVWNLNFDPRTTVVETHLSRLRSKIDSPEQVPLIRNIRGVGYKIDAA